MRRSSSSRAPIVRAQASRARPARRRSGSLIRTRHCCALIPTCDPNSSRSDTRAQSVSHSSRSCERRVFTCSAARGWAAFLAQLKCSSGPRSRLRAGRRLRLRLRLRRRSRAEPSRKRREWQMIDLSGSPLSLGARLRPTGGARPAEAPPAARLSAPSEPSRALIGAAHLVRPPSKRAPRVAPEAALPPDDRLHKWPPS